MVYLGELQVFSGKIGSFMNELFILIALVFGGALLLNVLFKITRKRKIDVLAKVSFVMLPVVLLVMYFQFVHFFSFEEVDYDEVKYKVISYDGEVVNRFLNREQRQTVDNIISEGRYRLSIEPLYTFQSVKKEIEFGIYDAENQIEKLYLVFDNEEVNAMYSPALANQLDVKLDVEALYEYLVSEFNLR